MEAKQKEEEKSDLKGKVSNDSIGIKNVKFKGDDGGKEDEDRRKSNVEKAADERVRIKKQYEKYKARKATLDDEQKVDVKKLKENEALQDDIRSLLSTIQERR